MTWKRAGTRSNEPEAAAVHRLEAALNTAKSLRDSGCGFVVAPVLTHDGAPLVQTDARFAVTLYPYVDGESFTGDDFSTPAHRRRLLDLVVDLHTAPSAAARHALADDFTIPHRDELELSLHRDDAWDSGPYADRASKLIIDNAHTIERLLVGYDDLVKETRGQRRPAVLTHGEPHPGNTMRTADGWMLIDWDTVLVAPPERDLWSLDPGDGSILGAYADATGVTPLPSTLDLYRLRWDLADIAVYVSRFRRQHGASADDEKSWNELRSLVSCLPT